MAARILGVIAALLFASGVAAYFEVRDDEPSRAQVSQGAVVAPVEPDARISLVTIAAWKDSPLVMPKTVPDGWKLVYADVLPASETVEGCDQFELNYEDPAADAGYLDLYQFPNACAKPFTGDGVTAFSAGDYRGVGRYSPDGSALVQVTVGPSTVQAHSNLTLTALTALLDEFVPLRIEPS